jgi:hypothetical protein
MKRRFINAIKDFDAYGEIQDIDEYVKLKKRNNSKILKMISNI